MNTLPPVRVRFCPAPSGWLHVGGARTALYNWLWARQHQGTMILRIEDTDAERASYELAQGMMDALSWLGLEWDEGIGRDDSPYGSYLQSERVDLHRAVSALLVQYGYAYEAYETTEELAAQREQAQGGHGNPVYKEGHRNLTEEQRAAYRAEGRLPVIRVRTPDEGEVTFSDAIRGEITFNWKDIGDFVILRADTSPTYMLANVVDDLSQGVSLIARGEDLLSATPRQILMQHLLIPNGSGAWGMQGADAPAILDEAMAATGYAPRPGDWATRMTYAHLPLLIGNDRKKLSKRHGDVAIDAYRLQGFLPEVMLNFLAILGWSMDGTTEHFTPEELIEAFTFDRVNANPSFFDNQKLRSLNGDAIKAMDPEAFGAALCRYLEDTNSLGATQADGTTSLDEHERRLVMGFAPHLQARCQTLADAVPMISFAFSDTITWDEKAIAKWLKPEAGEVLDMVTPKLEASEWTVEAISGVFHEVQETLGVSMGKVMQPCRVLVTGCAVSPPLPETFAVLDKQWVMDRLSGGRTRVQPAT